MSTPRGQGERIRAAATGIQENLSFDAVPASQRSALLDKQLISSEVTAAGLTGPAGGGNYDCYVDVGGLSAVDVIIKPGVISGAITPSVIVTYADGQTAKSTTAGVALVSNTLQTISVTGLRGERRIIVRFPLPAAATIASFSQAEVNGL